MVIIQFFLNIMEEIFSVEYITPQLIIDGAFNRLFNVLCVISIYYCILDPLLHLHPTSTLRCAYFELYPPFSLSACPTDVMRHCQGFVSFHVRSTYPPFYSPNFCVHSPCPFWPPLYIKNYMPSLKPHNI